MTATANPPLEFPVLLVDDEASIISALRRELNSPPLGRYRYRVEGFTNPHAALERAREQDFAAVISDYRMPEMSGLEFLKALAEIRPHCARIVLSGQTDMDALIQMINVTHIYRFIPKPWNSYFLKSSLTQAIDFRQENLRYQRMAERLLQAGHALPQPPQEVDRILVVDDEVEVAQAIARSLTSNHRLDQALATIQAELQLERHAMLDHRQISVQVCSCAVEAVRLAERVPFACVITDFRMPGLDGARLLETFAERQPHCTRILLSGMASMEEVIYAIDMAHIHSFLSKPWSDAELRACVSQALVQHHVLLENEQLAALCQSQHLD